MIIFSAIHIKNFRIDASSDTLVAQNDEEFKYFNFYNKIFTSENFLVLAVEKKSEIDLWHLFDGICQELKKLNYKFEKKIDKLLH